MQGLYIPHSEKRFPGYDTEKKELDAEMLRGYIFGEHIADYMRELQEDDEEAYKRQFARFVKEGITADDLEEMYSSAHAAIRASPLAEKSTADKQKIKAASEKFRKVCIVD